MALRDKIDMLKRIEIQIMRSYSAPTDEQRVKMAQSILNAMIDEGTPIDDVVLQADIPEFLGCSVDWTEGVANDYVIKITYGDYTVIQDTTQLNVPISSGAVSDEEDVAADKVWLTDSVILNENLSLSEITADLTLPVVGPNGSIITWSSENSSISNTGVVVQPTSGSGSVSGNIIATITKDVASDTKVFNTTVLEAAELTFTWGSPTSWSDAGATRPTDTGAYTSEYYTHHLSGDYYLHTFWYGNKYSNDQLYRVFQVVEINTTTNVPVWKQPYFHKVSDTLKTTQVCQEVKLDDSRIAVYWGNYYAFIAEVNPVTNSYSFGTQVQVPTYPTGVSNANTSYGIWGMEKVSANAVVFFYTGYQSPTFYHYYKVASISDTVITLGTRRTHTMPQNQIGGPRTSYIEDNKIMISYEDRTTSTYADTKKVGTISGDTITWGTVWSSTTYTNAGYGSIQVMENMLVDVRQYGNTHLFCDIFTLSGTTLTRQAYNQYVKQNATNLEYNAPIVRNVSDGHMLCVWTYQNDANNNMEYYAINIYVDSSYNVTHDTEEQINVINTSAYTTYDQYFYGFDMSDNGNSLLVEMPHDTYTAFDDYAKGVVLYGE